MKRFSLIEIGWCDGGPIIDLLSFGADGEFSVFCLNATISPPRAYLEILGIVLFDNYPDDEGD